MRTPLLTLSWLSLCCYVSACGSYPVVYENAGDNGGAGSGGTTSIRAGGTTSIDVGNAGAATGGAAGDAECGNGRLERGELCDDGDTEDGDGCSADCLEQDDDYACLEPGEPCKKVVVCGSGVIEGHEACDDGNVDSGDGCSEDCSTIEDGWLCPRPGRECVESPECGNGVLERGEACDDANTASGDGCTGTEDSDETACQLEDGYWCPGAGEDCVVLLCGNGARTIDEGCDDGNTATGDGCSTTCSVEPGWHCSTAGCAPECGDGTIVGNEGCDDGNRASGDGCSAACTIEPFFTCAGEPSECASSIECGNAVVDPGEICDPPGSEGCLDGCSSFSPEASITAECGNSVIEAGESCDPPSIGCSAACVVEDGYACPRPGTCVLLPICGDGMKQVGEGCDVGSSTSPGCIDCQVTAGWTCFGVAPSVCELWSCGDGTRQRGEECDDGGNQAGDGCSPLCTEEQGWHCSSSGCSSICGDGLVLGFEECDDGNRASSDGCSAACFIEPFFDCAGVPSTCTTTIECNNGQVEPGEICDPPGTDGCLAGCSSFAPDASNPPVCGNSIIEADETCDAPDPGNGCSSSCQVEDGYTCPRPGVCFLLPVCGDGTRQAGEGCDVGPTPTAGCIDCQVTAGWTCYGVSPSVCELWYCGDGRRTPGEACDDGGTDSGDGCSATCTLEVGWRCSSSGCQAVCGDGLVIAGEEECDDDNTTSSDGCSAACLTEPFFACSGEPSSCTSTIECGNSVLDPGEICDPPETNGCLPGCASFSPDSTDPPVCGDNVIQAGEMCDPPQVGNGCDASCQVESGYSCPRPGVCVALPVCGNGQREAGEACDVGASPSDGCVGCAISSGWICFGVAPSVCEFPDCGDGIRQYGEQCDDANGDDADGCSATCIVEDGWVCPSFGQDCRPVCGDSVLLGDEECDDGDLDNGDGCNAGCRNEPGWSCPTVGDDCVEAVCGNGGDPEPGEGCDDGNLVAGDGCGPLCQTEPTVTVGPSPVVNVYCGDGMVTGDEGCDDGNSVSNDGCSGTEDGDTANHCQEEFGFECNEVLEYPLTTTFQVTYRDFYQRSQTGGHPHMKVSGSTPPSAGDDRGIPGAVCNTLNDGTCGRLDVNGKPALAAGVTAANIAATHPTLYAYPDAFSLWYRSENPGGIQGYNGSILISELVSSLTLDQFGGPTSNVYTLSDDSFWPLDGQLFGNTPGQTHNFQFTTELRYFFQYQGGETLTFRGDDDVFVHVNGRLAVDIGGIHNVEWARVVLGDDGIPSGGDSDCTAATTNATEPSPCALTTEEATDTEDTRFGLERGGVYEIVLFHAERHPIASNFQLTLAGFLAPRSVCAPTCGDGEIVGWEVCDDGDDNSDEYGTCNTTCTGRDYCGDAIVQGPTSDPIGPEQCDNGRNFDTYDTGSVDACGPGCLIPTASCGDGILQPGWEECDNGAANSDSAYGPSACTASCHYAPYCGDGVEQGPATVPSGPEECDLGALNGGYGENSCSYDCQPGPYCGDNIRNGAEQCDDDSGHCDENCMLLPYCGDGLVAADEACDYGQFASDSTYGGCTLACEWGLRCGDNIVSDPYEECDRGDDNDDSAYDGCTESCLLGPRCGDATIQLGETCDNGFNDDVYRTTSGGECGPGCLPPSASCGDGTLQPEYEECDNGSANSDTAYGATACTTDCEYGGYCGDGIPNGTEACDNGAENGKTYGIGSCGYDCQPGPSCGDGLRNGPEECDGTAHCSDTCLLEAYCGDGLVALSAGEVCDYGRFASDDYGSCTTECDWGPGCGDGHVDQPFEECDLGSAGNIGDYDGCSANCTHGPRCGDGVRQASEGEACDNGFNDDIYGTGAADECGPGCTLPSAYCGDGLLDPAYEECDNGAANSNTAYGLVACTSDCRFGGFCGDGVVTSPETCDRGILNGQGYGDGSCSYDCQPGPRCGDNIRNGAEECDGTAHCAANCTLSPYCGDGVVGSGEACDYGQFASNAYGSCTDACEWGPGCGDGTVDSPYEECDLGEEDNVGGYGGCTETCTLGPRCGDRVRQAAAGEACDNGSNDDIYAYDDEACGAGCQLPPNCGDGILQSNFELCDYGPNNSDTTYNGCTSTCTWGPYCGDGNVDPDEICDEGASNTVYSASGVGCSYDCEPAPYCGDGVRNGPEECDNGTDDNVGGYGECNADCTQAPWCGDGVVQANAGEECDDGPIGSLTCSPACNDRVDIY